MVLYNPKEWWKLIFNFSKSDTFRIMLPGMIGVAVYTGVVAYLENEVFQASFKNTTIVHSLVGFALSLFLVFRTNTAYDRWWEGRKIWGGLVNNSRSLAMKIFSTNIDLQTKKLLGQYIVSFVFALKEHLREGVKMEELILDQTSMDSIQTSNHKPNAIAKMMFSKTNEAFKNGVITGEQLLSLHKEMQSMVDHLGACERIKRTPIPYSYSLFIKKVIFLYVFTMPIGFVREFEYWAMPIVAAVFYVFGSIEVLAEEIEDPFGTDTNDLPTDQICVTIKGNVEEIMEM